jgi:hypothetical protein
MDNRREIILIVVAASVDIRERRTISDKASRAGFYPEPFVDKGRRDGNQRRLRDRAAIPPPEQLLRRQRFVFRRYDMCGIIPESDLRRLDI